jgi:hypothetical protein
MKYLCLVFYDEAKLRALTPDQYQTLDDESLDYDAVLRHGGYLLAAQALDYVEAAAVVRVQHGKVMVTDGPFAETKEQIGGFILIDAADVNEAIQLASKIPAIRLGGVEVRPIKELVPSSGQ